MHTASPLMMETTMTLLSQATACPARPKRRHRGFFALFHNLAALRRQRCDLSRLDDHALHDIGINRSQALEEAARPVWDVPAHWHR